MEKEKNKSGFIIGLLVGIIVILLVLVILFATDTISFKNDNVNVDEENNPVTENNNEVNDNQEDTTGKIYIKRNGITNLETVPSDIVGTYINQDQKEDYFTLNADGTAEIKAPSGGPTGTYTVFQSAELTFQLTYIDSNNSDSVVIEFYTKNNTKNIPSPIRLGNKYQGEYQFTITEHTPTATANQTIFKKSK